jgi:hypothetical protein
MLPVRGKSSENASGRDFYWIALTHRRRAPRSAVCSGSAFTQQADQSASSIDRLFCATSGHRDELTTSINIGTYEN